MWDYLAHLWATPPVSLALSCPPPAAGQTANPVGQFDDTTVRAAYQLVSVESLALVALTVAFCYMVARTSTGPRFTRRWLVCWVATVLLCAGAAWVQLVNAPTTALAGSCETDPSAFAVTLPFASVVSRSLAAAVWALLVYPLLSVLLTNTVGRVPALGNGFFQNRGCPWPRLSPTAK
jgi:hypothetical protein